MRIGIFGGTFDPIHKGHIDVASAVLTAAGLDRLVFMPTGDPPHKVHRSVTPGALRLQMVRAAIKEVGNAQFSVSDMEIRRKGYTYTVDTLRALTEQAPETEYLWIIGADVLADLKHWKDYHQVFRLCSFIAMYRPGYSRAHFETEYEELTRLGARIQFVEVPAVDVSSTEIREACSSGTVPANWVPGAVAAIIRACGLYQGDKPVSRGEICQELQLRLSPARYAHSIGVMEEAIRIGREVGVPEETCALAGLLHDAAREFTPAQYAWLGLEGEEGALLHAKASAILASSRYGVENPEIIEAITCHTTGKPGMGILAQILFVADYTEAGRQGPHFDRVRTVLKEEGLLAAVLAECEMTLAHLEERGKPICQDTKDTRDWARRTINE